MEIGTAQGGSLRRISEWAGHVHSFDLVEPHPDVAELPNVTVHTGDGHVLLPEVLAQLAANGVNVDFALVDGDHSAEGVAQDMRDLLDSPAVGNTVIVMHDSMNPEVRRGLQAVDYGSWDKVRAVRMDFVAGFLGAGGHIAGEMWGGLALVIVDAEHPRAPGEALHRGWHADTHELILTAQGAVAGAAPAQPAAPAPAPAPVATMADAGELASLRADIEALQTELARHKYAFEVSEAAAGRLRGRLEALGG